MFTVHPLKIWLNAGYTVTEDACRLVDLLQRRSGRLGVWCILKRGWWSLSGRQVVHVISIWMCSWSRDRWKEKRVKLVWETSSCRVWMWGECVCVCNAECDVWWWEMWEHSEKIRKKARKILKPFSIVSVLVEFRHQPSLLRGWHSTTSWWV